MGYHIEKHMRTTVARLTSLKNISDSAHEDRHVNHPPARRDAVTTVIPRLASRSSRNALLLSAAPAPPPRILGTIVPLVFCDGDRRFVPPESHSACHDRRPCWRRQSACAREICFARQDRRGQGRHPAD